MESTIKIFQIINAIFLIHCIYYPREEKLREIALIVALAFIEVTYVVNVKYLNNILSKDYNSYVVYWRGIQFES